MSVRCWPTTATCPRPPCSSSWTASGALACRSVPWSRPWAPASPPAPSRWPPHDRLCPHPWIGDGATAGRTDRRAAEHRAAAGGRGNRARRGALSADGRPARGLARRAVAAGLGPSGEPGLGGGLSGAGGPADLGPGFPARTLDDADHRGAGRDPGAQGPLPVRAAPELSGGRRRDRGPAAGLRPDRLRRGVLAAQRLAALAAHPGPGGSLDQGRLTITRLRTGACLSTGLALSGVLRLLARPLRFAGGPRTLNAVSHDPSRAGPRPRTAWLSRAHPGAGRRAGRAGQPRSAGLRPDRFRQDRRLRPRPGARPVGRGAALRPSRGAAGPRDRPHPRARPAGQP